MSDSQKNLYKKLFGTDGESRAIKYLKKKKYKILERNYLAPFAEADIIAFKDGFYVFIEVKTRVDDKFGRPAEAVTYKKQEKYRMLASHYLMTHELEDVPVRFDVIEILGREINQIENAF